MSIISFCILKNMQPIVGPFDKEIGTDYTINDLLVAVKDLVKSTVENDPSKYFDDEFYQNYSLYISFIANVINIKKYFVTNHYNEIYVIAFAIDHEIFDIYSEGFDGRPIDWNLIRDLKKVG